MEQANIEDLIVELGLNKEIEVVQSNFSISEKRPKVKWGESDTKILQRYPVEIANFYQEFPFGLSIQWKAKGSHNPNVKGHINLLPFYQVSGTWENIVWFKDIHPSRSRMRYFRILDFFAEEACIGFFDKPKANPEIYLYFFEEDPIGLNIDFNGYLSLLKEAKGFFYWQRYIDALVTRKKNPEAEFFEEQMPNIFSGFSIQDFIELFNKVKKK